MKFLEAQKKEGKDAKKSILPDEENKMQRGNRADQMDRSRPETLISSPRAGRSTTQADAGKLAASLGVNLSDVKGTGPNGQITEKDVRLAAEKNKTAETK